MIQCQGVEPGKKLVPLSVLVKPFKRFTEYFLGQIGGVFGRIAEPVHQVVNLNLVAIDNIGECLGFTPEHHGNQDFVRNFRKRFHSLF